MKAFIFLIGLAAISNIALAHHSTAHYSREWTDLNGEIVNIRWANPHILFTLKTSDIDGEEKLVRMESGSVYYFERTGIDKDTLKVGDHIIAAGRLSTRRNTEFILEGVTLPSGEYLPLGRDDLQANFKDVEIDTVAENKGLFRVWGVPPNNKRELFESLNDEAKAIKAEFDPNDNMSTRCEPSGMPRIMWYPHPYEFVDLGDLIQLNIEMYDQVRTIYMNRTETPEDFAGHPLGYSIGHWENDRTLVVTTTDMDWGFYSNNNTPMTINAVTTERFTLSEDQSKLDFYIETTDAKYFNEPATIAAHWIAVDDKIEPYGCTLM